MEAENQLQLHFRVGGHVHCRFSGDQPRVIALKPQQEKDEEEKECASTLSHFLTQCGCPVSDWKRTEDVCPSLAGNPRPDFLFALVNGSRMAVEVVQLYGVDQDQQIWQTAQDWLSNDVRPQLTPRHSRATCYIQVPPTGLPLRGRERPSLTAALVQVIGESIARRSSGQISQSCALPGQVNVRISTRPASTPAVDFQLQRYSLVNENKVWERCREVIQDKAEKAQWDAVKADEKVLFIGEEWGFYDYGMLRNIVRDLKPAPLANEVRVFVGTRQFPNTVQELG